MPQPVFSQLVEVCVEHTRLGHTLLMLIERRAGGGWLILLNDRSRVVKGRSICCGDGKRGSGKKESEEMENG